jgi:hypothetical protein
MAKLVSTQRHINEEIVAAKRASADYTVSLSPAFELFGEQVQLVMDGHHSYAAAVADGVEPEFVTLGIADSDTIALLISGNVEDFLAATYIDSDIYDIITGQDL